MRSGRSARDDSRDRRHGDRDDSRDPPPRDYDRYDRAERSRSRSGRRQGGRRKRKSGGRRQGGDGRSDSRDSGRDTNRRQAADDSRSPSRRSPSRRSPSRSPSREAKPPKESARDRDRDTERGTDRKRRSERGAERDRDSDRSSERGAERGADGGKERGAERSGGASEKAAADKDKGSRAGRSSRKGPEEDDRPRGADKGSDRKDSGRTGSDRAGGSRTGADRAEQADSERASGSKKSATDRAASERTGSDRAGSDKVGSDKAGNDKAGSDRSGGDRGASDRPASDRAASDRAGSDRAGSERTGNDRAGSDRTGSERAGSDAARGETKAATESKAAAPSSAAAAAAAPAAGDKPAAASAAQAQQRQVVRISGKVMLEVSGCADVTINEIVKGTYLPYSVNHGRVVYRKEAKSKGFEVLVYYWDDRDGPELAGWWFGPAVGGDQVWAYHPSRTSTSPPSSQWNVPHDGTIDPSFTVTARSLVNRAKAKAAPQAPAPPSQPPLFEAQLGRAPITATLKARLPEPGRGADVLRPGHQPDSSLAGVGDRARREETERKRMELQRRDVEDFESKKQTIEAEQRRKAEEDNSQEHAEMLKKKAEADKAKEEATKKFKSEREKAERQKQATLNVLSVLRQLATATPENFEPLKEHLDNVLETELPDSGSQQAALKKEADRVLEYAQNAVKKVKEDRERLQKLQEEQERKGLAMLSQVDELISAAEEASQSVANMVSPLNGEPDAQQVVNIARDAQIRGRDAMTACTKCLEFIGTSKLIMDEAEIIPCASIEQIQEMLPRIATAAKRTAEAMTASKEGRVNIHKRLRHTRHQQRLEEKFKEYDKDGDGFLTMSDVSAYAKGEWNFDMPSDSLDRIYQQLAPAGSPGIRTGDFQLLVTAVGIVRAEVSAREARIARAEQAKREEAEAAVRQAHVARRKDEVNEMVSVLMKSIAAVEPDINSAELRGDRFAAEAPELPAHDLKERADAVDVITKDVGRRLQSMRKDIQEVLRELDMYPEFPEMLREQMKALSTRLEDFEKRLQKTLETSTTGRQLALYMALSEYESQWTEVVVKLRACIEGKGKTVRDLFGSIAGRGKSTISTRDIQVFLKRHKCQVELDKLDKIFMRQLANAVHSVDSVEADKELDDEWDIPGLEDVEPDADDKGTNGDAGSDDEDADDAWGAELDGLAKIGLSAEEAEEPRKPEALVTAGGLSDEVISAIMGTSLRITRKDFMRIIRMYYKVVKQTVLSDNLNIEKSSRIRRIDVGEVIEVQKGPAVDSSVNVYRIYGRCIRDGVSGWATIAGNQGVTFLVPGGRIFTCKATVTLSQDLKDLSGKSAIRQLQEGEILEVLEWARTSRNELGITRIRVKAQIDGAVGWATQMSKEGTVFLEAM